KGTIRDIPLKRLTFGTRSNDGFTVKTEWDLPSLLGTDAIDGLDLRVKLDYFEKRGTGFGLGAEYDFDNSIGEFDLYAIQDRGEDKTTSGKDIDQDGDWRGVALWEHTSNLPNGWKLQFQASYISDETYIDAWRPDDFESRRQYETSFYLQQITANRAISIYTSYDINDFISNDYLLASKGYTVDKLPETRFASYGNSWFDGKVTYSNEFRMSRMKFNFETHSENELGIRNGAYPTIGPNVPISDYHRARGLSSQYISRFDTRHEIAIPLKYDNLNFTPFLVGRFTAYSDDFEDFSGEDDDSRAFGAVGMRFSAQYQHVDNAVESSMFDLHRLRHIIEPNVTVWFGTSNVDQEDLPVYDTEVESLGTGTVVRAGLRNVWQTQRGGPGRWRSVDVLTLDAGVVYNSNDADRESPTPQFFDYRPEYSQFGDHGYGSFALMLSDSLSFTGTGIYDIEESLLARGSIGTELRHSPLLTSYVEYRYIEAGTSKLLGVGFNYLITPKYKIAISPQWDLEEDDLRSISARLQRAFPDFTLTTRIRYDDIRDETTVSASIDLIEF
ncbi:MAG: LPS assembly protein LptD, partial [Planctomycetota bacterium]|nr:LPS assembly protein LptD [Planctomycetota bacterium]